jgi:hypothetical protein
MDQTGELRINPDTTKDEKQEADSEGMGSRLAIRRQNKRIFLVIGLSCRSIASFATRRTLPLAIIVVFLQLLRKQPGIV